jgi:iron complex outermembrane receptor protein
MSLLVYRSAVARWVASGLAGSAYWVLSSAAMAQEANAPANAPQPAAQSADTTTIPEVVVTAQRRSENLQNVPIAVTALTADMLQQRGVANTQDLLTADSSISVSTESGYFQPRIRGIGDAAVGAGFESGIAVYVDGVYLSAAPGNLFSLSNIKQVEVLKGPQGTLFGRNSTGGLIQITTLDPSERFGGTASFTAANYSDYTGDLYLTGGLAPGVALNFTGHAEFQGSGWGTNQQTGEDVYRNNHDIALRSTLLLRPADGTKIRISGDYADQNSNVGVSESIVPGTGFPFPGLVPPTGSAWNVNESQPFGNFRSFGLSANVTQDVGFADLVSISAVRDSNYHIIFSGDLSNLDLINLDITQKDQQVSQEFQLASKASSKIKWVVGAFYFDSTSKFAPNTTNLNGFVQPSTPYGPIDSESLYDELGTRSLAGYAQATAPIFDVVNLTLGARYTHETKNITDITQDTQIVGAPAPLATTSPDQSVTYNRPTWRVALDHRFTPELMAFVSYNRGFKSGGFNGQLPTDNPFQPETIDAYEIGAKSDLFGRRLRLNASVFYYDYTNIQVARYVDEQQSFYNGAAAKDYGLDLDFETYLTDNFTLSGGMTLLHDRFTNFPNAIYSYQVPTGVDVTTASASGNRLPYAADFSGTLTATYHVFTSLGEASFDVSDSYSDGFYSQPDNILRQRAYHLVSLGTGLKFHNGWSARAWMRNAADEKIYSNLQAGAFDSGYSYMAPRTFGVTLGAKF